MAANKTFLELVTRGPNNKPRSFLEGVLKPNTRHENIIDSILGQLSNDDHNAMRCASRKMNGGLMATREDNETLRHKQRRSRDKVDVINLFPRSDICPDGIGSLALLRRCSRQGT